MGKKPEGSAKFTELRRQADELLRTTKRDVAAMSSRDVQRLVHELQVHEIELEMQNDELRRTQGELESARDRYVDLYDSAPTGYLTLNPMGMILEANLPACTLLGINRKDVFGKPVVGFVAAKDQATFLRHLHEMLNAGARQVCEVELAQQDDAPVSVRFESVAVQDEAGQHTRVLTALLDITKRLCAETALRKYQQGLEQQRRLEERERLGHDLHDGILQSLYAIGLGLEAGKTYLLQDSGKAAAALSQSIGELNSVMREVRIFIEDLEIANLPEIDLPEIDLPASLRTMTATLARLHGWQVRVSVDPAATGGLSHAQSLQIRNLAKEALSNSFRHARGTLVQLSLRQMKDGIRLTVRDNGTGPCRKSAKGTGQGFVSMAARAHKLGGTLSVQSNSGKGTRVVLDLPRKQSAEYVTS